MKTQDNKERSPKEILMDRINAFCYPSPEEEARLRDEGANAAAGIRAKGTSAEAVLCHLAISMRGEAVRLIQDVNWFYEPEIALLVNRIGDHERAAGTDAETPSAPDDPKLALEYALQERRSTERREAARAAIASCEDKKTRLEAELPILRRRICGGYDQRWALVLEGAGSARTLDLPLLNTKLQSAHTLLATGAEPLQVYLLEAEPSVHKRASLPPKGEQGVSSPPFSPPAKTLVDIDPSYI